MEQTNHKQQQRYETPNLRVVSTLPYRIICVSGDNMDPELWAAPALSNNQL